MMTRDKLVAILQHKIDDIHALIDAQILSEGMTESECQRCCLINRLFDFEHTVNGIQEDDMK